MGSSKDEWNRRPVEFTGHTGIQYGRIVSENLSYEAWCGNVCQIMAFYDNKHWILSNTRNAFRDADDTGKDFLMDCI